MHVLNRKHLLHSKVLNSMPRRDYQQHHSKLSTHLEEGAMAKLFTRSYQWFLVSVLLKNCLG